MSKDYEHGELLKSISVKAFIVKETESLVADKLGKLIQLMDIEGLEENESFELKNVIIEKRNNFSFQFAIIPTKLTEVNKLKRNLKKQFKKEFEKFTDAKPGKVTNLKCIISNKEDNTLKLFDGSFFRMKLTQPINFTSDKIELLFVKKSFSYNYVWETGLTTIVDASEKDSELKNLTVPEIQLHKNPDELSENQVGKWNAMLTTVTPPFTYSNFIFHSYVLAAAMNSPKKVMKLEDGTFKVKRGQETFNECRTEIKLNFRASNGEATVSCVCFTKIAAQILQINADEFTSMDQINQRKKIKEILYEKKILTLKKQIDKRGEVSYILLNLEDIAPKGT